ncbi:uncharacterized protein LOC110987758 isoform X2 [Acanthaster planci]|uniref:Uncharacterized protein LOC110987758 isoform X2 n=1 Tax=Acanthaster planci TaxID=133434 RepID=A0A8B7ZSR2_ACAPL|nr:uncharacterized protein LOC110987758 isoform X2 [Acanthaster planci]
MLRRDYLLFEVTVQVVLLSIHLCSIPVTCQDNHGGETKVRHRRTVQGPGNTYMCDCRSKSGTLMCSDELTDCDKDELFFGGSCYKFLRDNPKSRDDAHRDCIARNGHLVYIESEDEQTFLANHSQVLRDGSISAADHYWIGLIPTTNNTWLNRSLAHNDLFEFSQKSKAGCFSLVKFDGKLILMGENCNQQRHFICERANECSSSRQCTNHNSSCYWFGGPARHIPAQEDCSNGGGHLLYIQSQAKLKYITNLSGFNNSRKYWIGLVTQYAWLDGSRAVYQGFVRNDRSNNGGSLCFRLRPQDDFLWNDRDCSRNSAYICEREISGNVRSTQERHQGSEPCRSPLPNLNHLVDSVPLCVRSGRDYFNNTVLCQCNDETTCLIGCGCVHDVITNENETARCSCGSCSFAFDKSENGNESTTERKSDEPKTSGVASTPSREDQRSTENTATGGGGDSDGQVGISVGIPVAVSLVVLFSLVALVVAFIWWRRRGKRAKKGPTKPLTSNITVAEAHTINVNSTYGLDDDDDHVTGSTWRPIGTLNPQPDDDYTDIKPNDQAASESECYATIQSNGYTPDKPKDKRDLHKALHGTKDSNEAKNTPTPATGYAAYKPQRGNDVYTDLKKTQNEADSDDDPAVYTLIPNNSSKPDKDDSENEYVQPENKAPPAGQRIGAGVSKATNPQLMLKNLTKDSEYVDVDAPATAVGDSDQKGRSDYVDVDAPAVVFSDVSTPAIQSKQPMGSSGYVSVDGPSTKLPESQDHNYYQVENPSDNDEGGYSLASAPTDNAYDTFNRSQRPSLNVPINDGIYQLTDNPEGSEYNTFNRAGNRRPSKYVGSDDGVYSVTNPPGHNDYSTFNRSGDRRPSENVPTDDGVYSVTNPPGDNEYSTLDRSGDRRLGHNIPIDEGVYSLTDLPPGNAYSIVNCSGLKPRPRIPAVTNEK